MAQSRQTTTGAVASKLAESCPVMRIHISIDPVIFKLGAFQLRWYSLAIMVAIAVAVWFIEREFKRKGLYTTNYGNIAIWAIAGGIIGARVFHIIDDLGYYLD